LGAPSLAQDTAPAKQIENIIPILAVKDLDASMAYYDKVLGFKKGWSGGGLGMISRDGFRIYLSNRNQGKPGTWVWIGVQDTDYFHKEYVSSGVKIIQPPIQLDHAYEMHVEDLDGNVLRFGS
jgi:predicted enzyme related to lactoylglutathione lyase